MCLRAVTSPFCRPPSHLNSPVSATAGTVPGNRTVVAVSGDSSVCDDSAARPTAACARLPLCPRRLSPVSHQTMRIPINSLGFSQQVPCTSEPYAPSGSNEPFLPAKAHLISLCLRLRGLSPATAQSLRFLGTLRFVTILLSGQPPLVHACHCARGDCPRCRTKCCGYQ